MNPDYRTVFVITGKTFNWWFSAAGLLFFVLGSVLIVVGRKYSWPLKKSWVGYFMVVFSAFWTCTAFVSTFSEYRHAENAYREGRYSVVEGTVEHFRPMPYEGHSEECFDVKDVRFCYSDYIITAGFSHTASHGGPIREGLPVRIAYLDHTILRIDVPADRIPPTSDRQAREAAVQKQYADWISRDPRLDTVTLGFGFSMVVWTLWWNLDYRRFMKFWVKPPYKPLTVTIFRFLFVLWFLGAAD